MFSRYKSIKISDKGSQRSQIRVVKGGNSRRRRRERIAEKGGVSWSWALSRG